MGTWWTLPGGHRRDASPVPTASGNWARAFTGPKEWSASCSIDCMRTCYIIERRDYDTYMDTRAVSVFSGHTALATLIPLHRFVHSTARSAHTPRKLLRLSLILGHVRLVKVVQLPLRLL